MIGHTFSHYRIIEQLGAGGMGVVYLAEDTLLGRRVAIKTLTDTSGHFRARFLREARAVSALSHPHIATIHDYGETPEGQPYIVMEFVKGDILADLMVKETLTISRSLKIIREVAEGLAEAHRHGIIHRDIKPSNVAINHRGEVKVLDFGLAKQIDLNSADPDRQTLLNTQTREGVIVGTPMYLSPEQALGVDVDVRSDLFSLGGVLYECIAGKPPFFGGNPIEICAKVIRDDPPPPSQLNADISRELDRITLKALAKKQEQRYQTADDLIADLDGLQKEMEGQGSGHTITRLIAPAPDTRPTSALATLSDIFKRPRLSIGYVAAGLVLVSLVAFGAWYLTRAKPHQPKAEAQRLYELGTNALRAGSFFQASKALGLAIQSDDEFALAHARLAEAWMELDYNDKAKDELLRVGELTPDRSLFSPVETLYLDAVTGTVRRDFSRAIVAYSEIARLQPDQSQVHVDLGRAFEKNNQSDKAITSYLEATNRDPQNAIAFLRLGILYGRQHNLEGAKSVFDKAEVIYQSLGDVEGRAEVAYRRGALLNDIAGKMDEARAQLEQARDMAKVVNSNYQQIRILFQLSSVSFKEGKTDLAQQYAREAVDVARANQMESLIARGSIDLGYVYLARGDYNTAEQYFQQGLESAQRFGGVQNEARARLSLASLYMQRGEADSTLSYAEQARSFYQAGGYVTETSQALLLRGRAYQQKGDYKAARQSFEEQLKIADQTNDQTQIAYAHANLGWLLLDAESYAEALQHFDESYARNKSMGNQLYTGYDLLNRGWAFWRLGRHHDSRTALDQASVIARSTDSNFKELQAYLDLLEAQIFLSDRRFQDVGVKSRHAIDLAGAQNKIVMVRGKYLTGLAQTLSGQAAKGRALCQEATDEAGSLRDPLLLSRTQLALAEASLVSGGMQLALESARKSQAFFASAGLAESEWRAHLIAGLASDQAGDRENAQVHLTRAEELLSSLQQKWGTEVFNNYLTRPDIQLYRKQLPNKGNIAQH